MTALRQKMPAPAQVDQLLTTLVEAAKNSFRDNLKSIVLFGSGAEGRLRMTSDLNLLFVLRKFVKDQVDSFAEPLRVANVAARASVMYVMESELPLAAKAFAIKFDDILRRRRVLYGDDVIAMLEISRSAKKQQLIQVILNLLLRLRERYASTGLREEQLAICVAESAGPLRSGAATLLELEGTSFSSSKEALEIFTKSVKDSPNWADALKYISEARESQSLPPGTAASTMFTVMDIAEQIRLRAERLS